MVHHGGIPISRSSIIQHPGHDHTLPRTLRQISQRRLGGGDGCLPRSGTGNAGLREGARVGRGEESVVYSRSRDCSLGDHLSLVLLGEYRRSTWGGIRRVLKGALLRFCAVR